MENVFCISPDVKITVRVVDLSSNFITLEYTTYEKGERVNAYRQMEMTPILLHQFINKHDLDYVGRPTTDCPK